MTATAPATIASHRPAPARSRSRSATGSRGRPKLKVLNQQAIRQRARRRNALLALFVIVLLGFFAVAFIQAQLVADQQDLDVLRARIAEAENDRARIARDVEMASSPAAIVGRAKELGMVRAYQPVYLEAVAPIQDIPNAAIFQPSEPPAFELAAPQVAAASDITVGVSTSGRVSGVAEATVEVAAPRIGQETAVYSGAGAVEIQPAPTADAAGPAVTTGPVVTSLGGLAAVSADGSATTPAATATATPAPTPAPSVSVADVSVSVGGDAATSAAPAGSIAGSRAVTGGPGDG